MNTTLSTLDAIRSACTAQARCDSPLGPLLLARTSLGLAGVWFDGQRHHPGELAVPEAPGDALLRQAKRQLQRYFEGSAVRFDITLDLLGTDFQRSVWQALQGIAPGSTCRYGDIAARIGAPRAARAVGAAVGANPLSIIVPCHRVLGQGGALTGYAGGLERKVALLRLEATSAGIAHAESAPLAAAA